MSELEIQLDDIYSAQKTHMTRYKLAISKHQSILRQFVDYIQANMQFLPVEIAREELNMLKSMGRAIEELGDGMQDLGEDWQRATKLQSEAYNKLKDNVR